MKKNSLLPKAIHKRIQYKFNMLPRGQKPCDTVNLSLVRGNKVLGRELLKIIGLAVEKLEIILTINVPLFKKLRDILSLRSKESRPP